MSLTLDHLVLGTGDLDAGTAHLTEQFGVAPFGGGEHELFATHNKLWRLEAAHYPIYLELIAKNPAASPKRARWFGLDDAEFAAGEVRPIGMVARTGNMVGEISALGLTHYEILMLSRGNLRWQFGIGQGDYEFPSMRPDLIEWSGAHPLDGVASQGLHLKSIHWPAELSLALDWPCQLVPGPAASFGFEIDSAQGKSLEFKLNSN